MPAPFDEENMSTIVDLYEYANTVTSPTGYHYFGDLTIGAVWIIVWAMFSNYYRGESPFKPMIISSFAAFFLAVMFDLISLVDRLMVVLPFAGLLLSIVADKILEE
jgi:hypothetical protein